MWSGSRRACTGNGGIPVSAASTPACLPDGSFRGRFASRNAAFTDVMIRTGLRISEQTGLSLYELPRPAAEVLTARGWLPAPIAKGGSARHVYFPAGVLKDVWDYVEIERAEAIDRARQDGVYEQIPDPLLIEDPAEPVVRTGGRRVPIAKLGRAERARLLVVTPDGREPAALWLNESGLPGTAAGYREVVRPGKSGGRYVCELLDSLADSCAL
jgi:hypothetical protein